VTDWRPFLELGIEAARRAGTEIGAGVQRPIDVRSKGVRDLLTDVDLAAERAIVQAIRNNYPDHDVLTEETPPGQRTSRYCWVIDPLDGTGNFSRRLPLFSTSIALTVDDVPVVGVVYDPLRDQLFAAQAGGGATLNGQPLHVTENAAWIQCVVGMDWTRDAQTRAGAVRIIADLTPVVGSLRILGSAALGICYVGAGILDAYWHLGLSPWDVAAGAVVVREAGGQVTDASGSAWRPSAGPCLASNGRLHKEFCEYVSRGLGFG
jgi:myo-inositol-1(or 4)-monophosphatase